MPVLFGLDLGQSLDYSALAGLDQSREGGETRYALRGLRRWPLKTSYETIVADTAAAVGQAPTEAALVVDATGVGAAVVEMLSAAGLATTRVLITAGLGVTQAEDRAWHVPKRELVSVMQVLLQGRRLAIARGLPEARLLARELAVFKVKVTAAGNERFESWRERDHDDLVLAVALACWYGERGGGPFQAAEDRSGRSAVFEAPKGVFLT